MGIEKMKNRCIRHVLILLLCSFCHTAAFAYGYDRNDQSKAWGYRPLYSTAASAQTKVVGSGYAGHSGATYQGIYSTANAAVAASSVPTYSFRTTSVYIHAARGVGRPVILAEHTTMRKSVFDGPGEDDDPTGVVPDPAPLGDVPWLFLLLLASGYLAYRKVQDTKLLL